MASLDDLRIIHEKIRFLRVYPIRILGILVIALLLLAPLPTTVDQNPTASSSQETSSSDKPTLPAVSQTAPDAPASIRFSGDTIDLPSECANIWELNPSSQSLPFWLTTPKDQTELSTSIPYGYLATQLIKHGAVNAALCPDNGMQMDGQVSACGLSLAKEAIDAWKNQFSNVIQNAAEKSGIPAQTLKTIFSRESPVWPGITIGNPQSSLGQMTMNGADTALMWNASLYKSFCPTVLHNGACSNNYALLSSEEKTMLRAGLVSKVNHSFCKDCPLGIDVGQSDESAVIFGETLKANCSQVGAIVRDIYGGAPGDFADYSDLWRFTLVNYNAGSGCLAHAVQAVQARGEKLTWANLNPQLTGACSSAREFVNSPVFASEKRPPGPNRYTTSSNQASSHQWKLSSWKDNKTACLINIGHEGQPTDLEVHAFCGTEIYEAWRKTTTCNLEALGPGACNGYFLALVKTAHNVQGSTADLPPASVWLTLDGCVPRDSSFYCDRLPNLIFHSNEPLAGQSITSLQGQLGGKDFSCDSASSCGWALPPTPTVGLPLVLWANSSYGDSSEPLAALIHLNALSEQDKNGNRGWSAAVLSDPFASCSAHGLGGAPDWLSTPPSDAQLETHIPYEWLAAHLIQGGLVDVSACSDFGLTTSGGSSACGQEAAKDTVQEWQNRFDRLIFSAANKSGVPAQLMKALFAKESQFWPGKTNSLPEAGLGQMTDNGADTTLLWNRAFFGSFCPTVLESTLCQRGYANLSPDLQAELRRILVNRVDADCPSCSGGIDLLRAETSIGVFGETLKANCLQTGNILHSYYPQSPAGYISFMDAWRFTLVNYNAGPGCLSAAVKLMRGADDPLDWTHLVGRLPSNCSGASGYVTDISGE